MHPDLTRIFLQAHRRLKPGTAPDIVAEFFPFAGLNHTIRRRAGRVSARVSDVLRGAPDDVLTALAALLIGRLDRRRIDPAFQRRYREYILRDAVQNRARAARIQRGRPVRGNGAGRHVDLDAAFDRLNRRFFDGALAKVRTAWSRTPSRRRLGRCDADTGAIVISRFFDSPEVPDFVTDYVLYHEMLHLQQDARTHGARRIVHTPEFRAAIRRHPHHAAAQHWLDANLDPILQETVGTPSKRIP
jgi:hypothetical protein